jgi:hypothetical protein
MRDARKFDVIEREQAIVKYLRANSDDEGASIAQIHEHLTTAGIALTVDSSPVRDTVTVQAYHKLVARMHLDGRLVEARWLGPGGTHYTLAPMLHADTAVRLDDIREALVDMAPTEALAELIYARESVRGKERKELLFRTAQALQKLPPRAFVQDLILSKVASYNADIDIWQEHDVTDERHRSRIKNQRMELENLCYRWFGLSHQAVRVPPAATVATGSLATMRATVDERHLAQELVYRVFGDTFIDHVPFDNNSAPETWANVVVAGSDGSTYSSVMQIDTAANFIDAGGSEVVTFNNSIVYLHLEGANKQQHPTPMYSVPITRSAIDSPHNAGMVLAPFMFRNAGLSESEYEHMAKCATDVVQWRADERVFLGGAPALGGDGRTLPPPRVHLRDGTVTLQERELNHYQRNDPYGEMVRAGVRLSENILRHITTRRQPPILAGAVKSSQLRLFATLISWFIAHGHPASGLDPIEPSWDVSRGAILTDNEVVTALLSTLADSSGDGYFCTFAVARPFHATTDLHRQYESERPDFWTERIRDRQRSHVANPDSDTYWVTVDAIEDDPFVRMCESADYAMFYIGHTAGDPAPLAPRYEFLESIRTRTPEEAAEHVRRNIELIVAALKHTKFTPDLDHNFLTGKKLVKIVPRVIYAAHEYCKALGRRLESELKSAVVAQLVRVGRARKLDEASVHIYPLNKHQYLDKQRRANDADDRRQLEGALEDDANE